MHAWSLWIINVSVPADVTPKGETALLYVLLPKWYHTFASQKLSHLLISAAPPVWPTVNVNVLSGLQGPFSTFLCEEANETSGQENTMFLKSQQPLALLLVTTGTVVLLINKTWCTWPENLQVMRPTSDTCRGRSRVTVGVISSGQGPQTGLGLLISTCHQAGYISLCPDDRGSC